MKRWNKSFASQIFTAIMSALFIVAILHAFFFQYAFTSLYTHRLQNDRQAEFVAVCDEFSGTNENSYDKNLSQYASANETAVLVFDEDYSILDTGFFSNLTMLTAEMQDGQYLKIPIPFLKELPENLQRDEVVIGARRLGNSKYCVPYTIHVNDATYYQKNDSAVANKRVVIPSFQVKEAWYSIVAGSKTSDRTWLIYNAVKGCLLEHAPIDTYLMNLPKISAEQNSKEQIQYFTYNRVVDGKKTYFVTINTVGLTGSEAIYMRKYLLTLYACLFGLLTIAAYIIARRLSRPTKELSEVANKIAKCDFSARAKVESNDELGQLATNINIMADNLENAMGEIIQAAEDAKNNEERIRMLLANLAHEFKTPLSIISLYTEVIEAGVYEKNPSYYFHNVNEQIDTLTRMVDETIQLSKLQSGTWNYSPQNHTLSEIVNSALSPFLEQIEKENFKLSEEIPDIEVYVDGVRIKQVLTNLISNAMKYSDARGRIAIKAIDNGDEVEVQVTNSGNVSQDDLERIWTRYYRASEQTTTRLPSEGIGLDIVRAILEMHSSRYGVKNLEHEIMFYFTLAKHA